MRHLAYSIISIDIYKFSSFSTLSVDNYFYSLLFFRPRYFLNGLYVFLTKILNGFFLVLRINALHTLCSSWWNSVLYNLIIIFQVIYYICEKFHVSVTNSTYKLFYGMMFLTVPVVHHYPQHIWNYNLSNLKYLIPVSYTHLDVYKRQVQHTKGVSIFIVNYFCVLFD